MYNFNTYKNKFNETKTAWADVFMHMGGDNSICRYFSISNSKYKNSKINNLSVFTMGYLENFVSKNEFYIIENIMFGK